MEFRAVVSEGAHTPISDYPIPPKIYDTPIEDLDLSVRAYNCLKRSNITRVGQILSMNEEDLLAVRNFGEKSLQELCERLLLRGFLPKTRRGDAPLLNRDEDSDDISSVMRTFN
jgi:DNA-directed RNA polymerase subunit alpha